MCKRKLLLVLKLMFVLIIITQISTAAELKADLIGSYKGDASTTITNSVKIGDLLYFGQGNNFKIIDIKDSANPVEIGKISTVSEIHSISVLGTYAYLGCNEGLYVVDLKNSASPSIIGSYNNMGTVTGVAVQDNSVYITTGQNGFKSINAGIPTKLTLRGSTETSGNAENLAIAMYRAKPEDCPCFDRTYAYIADGDNGLVIVDAHPSYVASTIKGSYNTPGHAYSVVISNNYAYVADGTNGVIILDISTPSSPVLVGTYSNVLARNIALSGNYLYIASENSGLTILDVSNPRSPVLSGNYNSGGNIQDVMVADNNIYLSDINNGLLIVATNENNIIPQSVISQFTGENVAVYDPSTAKWAHGNPTNPTIVTFGKTNSIPIIGDWNGDGRSEPGTYNPQSNSFDIITENGDIQIGLGWLGVIPVSGDWNGDGKDEVGVYDPATGQWAIGNDATNAQIFGFGWVGTKPLVGDWNGDSKDEVGVYNPTGNNFVIQNGSSYTIVGLGWDGVIPKVGDWDGNGKDEVGVYDPATGQWALWNSTTKSADIKGFGWSGTEPIVGDWNNDRIDEVGIYNRAGNNFVIQNGSSYFIVGLGWDGVIPVVGRCP